MQVLQISRSVAGVLIGEVQDSQFEAAALQVVEAAEMQHLALLRRTSRGLEQATTEGSLPADKSQL
jgi:hypothetical protein